MNKSNKIKALHSSISSERLQRFLSHSGDDFGKALKLYEQNMHLSAEFYPFIACFEICLRNKIHESMQKDHGSDWLIKPDTPLKEGGRDKVKQAGERLFGIDITRPENMGKIVAGLSLGFWVVLLSAEYEESLWRPTIRFAFPNYKGKLRPLRRRIYKIRNLRNRIAHHEPIIFSDDIEDQRAEIIQTIGWMCADTKDWVAGMAGE